MPALAAGPGRARGPHRLLLLLLQQQIHQRLQEEQQQLQAALLPLPLRQLHQPRHLLLLLQLAPGELRLSCELLRRLLLLLPWLGSWCLRTRAWCCSVGGTC
jgi:hypothetical protein